MTCHARQYSDQMLCGPCALAWDVNDPEPPACARRAPSRLLRLFPALALVLVTAAHAAPRSSAEVRAFRKVHACPATADTRGACPGYVVDVVRPLCAGGADLASNMQWLTVEAHRAKTRIDRQQCAVAKRSAP